jgi:hypothetical protein
MHILLRDDSRTDTFPPFGHFVSELRPVIGSLVALEEIELQIHLSSRAGFELSAKWLELEEVLRKVHQESPRPLRLRKLGVRVRYSCLGPDFQYPGSIEEEEDARRKWGELWEGYSWCRENLDFFTHVAVSRRYFDATPGG